MRTKNFSLYIREREMFRERNKDAKTIMAKTKLSPNLKINLLKNYGFDVVDKTENLIFEKIKKI